MRGSEKRKRGCTFRGTVTALPNNKQTKHSNSIVIQMTKNAGTASP